MKKALITGIVDQDGAALAHFLFEKGYEVHCIKGQASPSGTPQDDLSSGDHPIEDSHFRLHCCNLTDSSNLTRILSEIQPDEVYNLGVYSNIAVSFGPSKDRSAVLDAIGTLRLFEAIRFLGLEKKIRFYQASTFGNCSPVQEFLRRGASPLHPSPLAAVAVRYAHIIPVNYREIYGMHACNGFRFNQGSPYLAETFVARKITRAIANIAHGLEQCLYLGSMDTLRDWGSARDYARMQWMVLQQEVADDYVMATGNLLSVREFVRMAAAEAGITIEFTGSGVREIGTVAAVADVSRAMAVEAGDVIVRVDPLYPRPAEGETLRGELSKAKVLPDWTPESTLEQVCAEMVAADMKLAESQAIHTAQGHTVSMA
jgi:GDPmannose 4,6-dehydratase